MTEKKKAKTEKEQMERNTRRLFLFSGSMLILLVMLVLLFFVSATGFRLGQQLFSDVPAGNGTEQTVVVESTDSIMKTAGQLEEAGIIANRYLFVGKSMLFSYQIQPGTYKLSSSMTDREILNRMSQKTETE